MRKRQNLLKRVAAFLLATLSFWALMPMGALAAEPDEVVTPAEQEGIFVDSLPVDTKGDKMLDGGMANIVTSATIKLELSSYCWDAGFYITVLGNQGAKYEVTLTAPDGSQKVAYVTGGSSNLSAIAYALCAMPGTYKFVFIRISGDPVSARAIAEIHG